MRNVLLVGWREVWHQIRSRSFIFTTLGLPILMIAIWTLSMTFGGGQKGGSATASLTQGRLPDQAIGYVDRAGLLRSLPAGFPEGLFVAFDDEAAAAKALEEKRIGAYYVLPADYLESGKVKRVSSRLSLVPVDKGLFTQMVASNLLSGLSAQEAARLRAPFAPKGIEFIPLSSQDLAETSQRGPGLAPFAVAMMIMMPLFMAGGYLLQGLVQEKENRVIEILLVSLRPWQLLAGKLVGLGALTIVQFGTWLLIGWATAKVTGRDVTGILGSVDLSGGEPALIVAYAIGGFVLYATLMAGLGAMAPNLESTRMWSFFIGAPMLVPIMLWSSIATSPNGPLAVVLSIIPFSSPVGMIMRLMSTSVAVWEVALSLALLATMSVAMLLLMSRLFRAGSLLSGQPLSIGRFWKAVCEG